MARATFLMAPVSDLRWTRIEVSGDLDIAASPEFDFLLFRAIWAEPAGHLVADLSAVTFVDCAGLRPLVRARHALGGRFWLARVPGTLTRLLDLTRLTSTFAVLDLAPATARVAIPAPSPAIGPRPDRAHRL